MNQLAANQPSLGSPGTNPEDWARKWSLMRADTNMLRDVLTKGTGTILQLKFDSAAGTFTPVGDVPRAFVGAVLERKGTQVPDLESVGIDPFPKYGSHHETRYINALDDFLIPYLDADRQKENGGDLVRLEGVIKIQCGWPKLGTRHAQLNPAPHFVNTDVRLYQFKEGMKDADEPSASSSTLLVVWAPDAPIHPANPDGTVLGIS